MKRNVLIFGLVLGTILCANMLYMVNICYNNPEFESNDILGYTVMLVVFSMTFFGIRNYRNKELNGIISFGRAFKTGALIAFAGSTMYVATWIFCYYLFVPDYLDKYTEHVLIQTAREGSDVNAKAKEMADFKEMYKSPLMVILITYMEVFPIGLIVALISSLVLKKKARQENVQDSNS
jgi:hypothetical protein